MRKFYLMLFLVTTFAGTHAQTFHKYFSSPLSIGSLYRCIQTSDGGYAAAGQVTDITTFGSDMLLVKTDASGNLSWSKQIPFLGIDNFTDIIETSGGGIVVAGSTMNSSTFISEAIVAKYDASGTLVWSNSYTASSSSTVAKRLAQDALGNIYVFGSISISSAPEDYFIMKLDGIGNLLRQTYFSTPEIDFPLGFARNSTNGDFYISGWHNNSTGENIHLMKIDSNMTVSWNLLMSGATQYFCYDIKARANGNVVLAGRYDDTVLPYSVFLAEIDASGNQVWANNYAPLDSLRCYAYGITINGTNVGVAGTVDDTSRGTLAFAVNPNGNTVWSERIGAAAGENGIGYGIGTTSDGGYIVSGDRSDNISSNSIVQMIRLTNTGVSACNYANYPLVISSVTLPSLNLVVSTAPGNMIAQNVSLSPTALSGTGDACAVGMDELKTENNVSVYPNPASENVSVFRKSEESGVLAVFNSLGEKLFQQNVAKGETEIKIDIRNIPAGTYFILYSSESSRFTKEFVKE